MLETFHVETLLFTGCDPTWMKDQLADASDAAPRFGDCSATSETRPRGTTIALFALRRLLER